MANTKQTYLGVGKVYLALYASTDPLLFVGNVSQLDLGVEEDEQSLRDYTQPGGGEYDNVRRVSSVTLAMTQWDLSKENLSRALRGSSSSLAGAAITDEAVVARLGGLVELARLPDPAVALTVTNTAGSTTYLLGTDYERTPSGFIPLESGAITEAQALEVSYTALATDVVEALRSADQSYRLVFEGLNEAESGRAVVVRINRAKFGPLQNLPLIGDGFASITVNGSVLADPAVTAVGRSKYFRIERATA